MAALGVAVGFAADYPLVHLRRFYYTREYESSVFTFDPVVVEALGTSRNLNVSRSIVLQHLGRDSQPSSHLILVLSNELIL